MELTNTNRDMYKRVIFIIESPFCKRDYIRYGIENFINRNYEVLIWDFTVILRPLVYRSYTPPDPVKYKKLNIFFTKKEAIKELSILCNKDVVICIIRQSLKNHFLFKKLRNSDCYFGALETGSFPKVIENKSIMNYTKSLLKKIIFNPESILNTFYIKVLYPILFTKLNFRFIIYGGWNTRGSNNLKKYDTAKVYINSHALDYDLYLKSINEESTFQLEGDYALFIDEYVPFHPDNIGREIDATEENYYPDINNFFDRIEKEFGLRVIISAHPRAHYVETRNPFKRRQIFYGETANLIKYSKLVLTHASTANNFTVLFNKPVLFINSKKYSSYFQSSIKCFANELGKEDIDISSNFQLSFSDCRPDKLKYTNYKNKYIKDVNSPEIYFWELFINYLNIRA